MRPRWVATWVIKADKGSRLIRAKRIGRPCTRAANTPLKRRAKTYRCILSKSPVQNKPTEVLIAMIFCAGVPDCITEHKT
jgi:hypothetical protein